MAAIILGAVGSAIGGPILGAVGSIAGAYVDQELGTYHYLFGGPEDYVAPKLHDLVLQTAHQGAPAPRVFGQRVRVGGQLIWLSEMMSEGGTVGKRGEVTPLSWYAHIGVAFAQNECSAIKRLWADGDLVYHSDPTVTISGTLYEYRWDVDLSSPAPEMWVHERCLAASSQMIRHRREMEFEGEDIGGGNIDLTQFRSGEVIEWSTASSPAPDYQYRGEVLATRFNVGTVGGITYRRPILRVRLDEYWNGSNWVHLLQGASTVCAAAHYHGTTTISITTITVTAGVADVVLAGAHGKTGTFAVYFSPHPGITHGTSAYCLGGGPYAATYVSATRVSVTGWGAGGFAGASAGGTMYVLNPPVGASTTSYWNQDLPQSPPGLLTNWAFRLGTETQLQDALHVAHEGQYRVPAYRGTTYVIANAFRVGSYGNRIPSFTAELEQSATLTQREMVEAICTEAGMDASYVDASGVTGSSPVQGYEARGVREAVHVLQPVMIAADILIQQQETTLRFFKRDEATVVTVDADDFDARESIGSSAAEVLITSAGDKLLPKRLVVSFLDVDNDLQSGVEDDRRNTPTYPQATTQRNAVRHIKLPMAMSSAGARQTARRLLARIHAARKTFELRLPPQYMTLQEGDVLSFTIYGQTWRVLLSEVSLGANYVVECRGVMDSTANATGESLPEMLPASTDTGSGEMYLPPSLDLSVIDLAALSDVEMQTPGVYLACSLRDPTERLSMWSVYSAPFEASTYDLLYSSGKFSTMGVTLPQAIDATFGALGDASGSSWDTVSTILVRIWDGELSSATEAEVRSGANRVLVGDEILAFTTATLVEDYVYTLSGLSRGLLGTEPAISTHLAGERFVMLANAQFVPVPLSAVGTARDYKPATEGTDLDTVDAITHTVQNYNSRPSPVANLTFARDGSDNLTFAWRRRTRATYRIFGVARAPAVEATESYRIEFWYGSTLERSKTVAVTTSGYAAVEQVDDGRVAGDNFDVKVYQVSAITGDGRVAEITTT